MGNHGPFSFGGTKGLCILGSPLVCLYGDVRAGELLIPVYLLHDVACKARDVDLIHIDT